MSFLCSDLLYCPLDKLALRQQDTQLRCASGHCFDIARQGYVNLLVPGDKRSRDPGDSKDMVVARRAFLSNGHYKPIAQRLIELVKPLSAADSVIVDAGCGEGYYLEQLRAHLPASRHTTPTVIGFDISRPAMQAAARRFPATWLVASNRNIPLASGSADCLLSMFGFPNFETFLALLKQGGTLLTVDAGPQHLIELREVLYPSVRHTASRAIEKALAAGFTKGHTSTLQFTTAPLGQSHIHQLLGMTPHLFRASHEGKERAAQLNDFPITVDVVFQLLHKPATAHQARHKDPDSA